MRIIAGGLLGIATLMTMVLIVMFITDLSSCLA